MNLQGTGKAWIPNADPNALIKGIVVGRTENTVTIAPLRSVMYFSVPHHLREWNLPERSKNPGEPRQPEYVIIFRNGSLKDAKKFVDKHRKYGYR